MIYLASSGRRGRGYWRFLGRLLRQPPIQYIVPLLFSVVLLVGIYANSSGLGLGGRAYTPYMSFRRHAFTGNGTLIVSFTTSEGLRIVGVERVLVMVNGRRVDPLRAMVYNGTSIAVVLPYNVLYELCALGGKVIVSTTLRVRYMNYTARMYSNEYYAYYPCRADFTLSYNGTRMVITGVSPQWVRYSPYPINLSIELYGYDYRTRDFGLIYYNHTVVYYRGDDIVINLPSYRYGYVRLRYFVGGKPVLKAYRIEYSG